MRNMVCCQVGRPGTRFKDVDMARAVVEKRRKAVGANADTIGERARGAMRATLKMRLAKIIVVEYGRDVRRGAARELY